MSKLEFVRQKLLNFHAFLSEACKDHPEALADIDKLKNSSASQVILYFNNLANQGITADEYVKTINKYVDTANFKEADLDKFKRYIAMFLEVCS